MLRDWENHAGRGRGHQRSIQDFFLVGNAQTMHLLSFARNAAITKNILKVPFRIGGDRIGGTSVMGGGGGGGE